MKPVDFAVQLEHDGEKYYTEQAEKNNDAGLHAVFTVLAEEERKHAEMLEASLSDSSMKYNLEELSAKSVNVFKDLGDVKSEIRPLPEQIDVYRIALEMEKKSIDLYRQFAMEAADEPSKALFSFLVKQEEKHLALLDELVRLLRHAKEWPESMEFGLREEY